ncbi:hypothetical protein C8J57DRAFT_1259579 [Mycena rebaudengoi]|nr:hypothetical protein C8J57DRAFT_1259579 [Mycena rebaudengoi]
MDTDVCDGGDQDHGPGFDFDEVAAQPFTGTEYFKGAAEPLKDKGESFVDWFNSDQFAHHRVDNIYYPFANKDEWELASFLLRSSMTMRDIDDFLGLKMVRERLPLSFKSAKELRARAELLPSGPPWKSTIITYDGFPTKSPLVLYYRDSLQCVEFLLKNPLMKDHVDLIPKLNFRNGQRLHSEWINSDGAWEMQTSLPSGATLLGVVATSDKTNISVMNGDRVAHPLLTSLANFNMDFLMKASNHAFMMTALLPVPKFLCAKDLRGLMEKRLMHHCLDIVYAPLKTAAAYGHKMSDSVGRLLNAYTPLAAYIVDTPEAADIACVMGKTSHLTLASHKSFGDSFRHPERTGAHTWARILDVNSRVNPWDLEAYQKESKKFRLSGVHLPFWRNWPLSTNPAKFLTPEPLHHLHKGFYDHDFLWCKNILKPPEIDFRLSVIQPRIGFRHFKEGVTRLKQLGGREHRELEQCIIAVIADAAPREVVCAIRALIDFRYLAQAPEIDEETITRISSSLQEFHDNKQHIINARGLIRWAGVPIQFTADVTEKAHSTQIKVPARTETNHLRLRPPDCPLDLDAPDGEEESDDAVINPEGPSLTGESARPIRNLFKAAELHNHKYRGLASRITPPITVEDAAQLFGIEDLRPALGDYFKQFDSHQRITPDAPIIGGSVRVQVKSPHKSRPLAAQNLQAQPPGTGEWEYGRYDTVLLCDDPESIWPGEGLRDGLKGHTVAQIRLIMRPVWGKSKPPTTAYLMYAQRYDIVSQNGTATGCELLTGMYILKQATRSDGSRLGDIVDVKRIRIPVELIARFGQKADKRFTPFNSLECSTEVRLNKYSSKELFWALESVSPP